MKHFQKSCSDVMQGAAQWWQEVEPARECASGSARARSFLSAMTGVRALLRRAQSPMRRARKMAQVTNLPLDEDWTAMEDL